MGHPFYNPRLEWLAGHHEARICVPGGGHLWTRCVSTNEDIRLISCCRRSSTCGWLVLNTSEHTLNTEMSRSTDNSWRSRVGGLLIAVVAFGFVAAASQDPTHRAGVSWDQSSYVEISQTITPVEISDRKVFNFFMTHNFLRVQGSNSFHQPATCSESVVPNVCDASGFYFGVQPFGIREDNTSHGPLALFSVWNSDFAVAGPQSLCQRFGGEGVGHTCKIDLDTIAGDNLFKVKRLADGKSWVATLSQSGGTELVIGTITHTEILEPFELSNVMEHYGSERCGATPGGYAKVSAPQLVFADGTKQTAAVTSGRTACPDAKVLQYKSCDAIFLGDGPLNSPPTDTNGLISSYAAPPKVSQIADGKFNVLIPNCKSGTTYLQISSSKDINDLSLCVNRFCSMSTSPNGLAWTMRPITPGVTQSIALNDDLYKIVNAGGLCFQTWTAGAVSESVCVDHTTISVPLCIKTPNFIAPPQISILGDRKFSVAGPGGCFPLLPTYLRISSDGKNTRATRRYIPNLKVPQVFTVNKPLQKIGEEKRGFCLALSNGALPSEPVCIDYNKVMASSLIGTKCPKIGIIKTVNKARIVCYKTAQGTIWRPKA